MLDYHQERPRLARIRDGVVIGLIRFSTGLAAGFSLLIFLCHSYLVISQPYQLEYGEGHMLGLAYQLRQGHSIYAPGQQPPFVFGLHLPFYLWLVGLTMGDPPTFTSARLISTLAVVALLLISLAWLKKKYGALSAWAGLGFLCMHPLLLGWSSLARVDNLGFALSALAVLWAHPLGSGLLCLLAFLTKQSFVAAPLALALAFGGRKGLGFLAGYGLSALVVLSGLQWFWSGGTLPLGSRLVVNLGEAFYLWKTYGLSVLGLLILAALGWRDRAVPPALRFYVFTAFIPVLAALKQGSFYNYFLELHWALALLAAASLARLDRLRVALLVAQLVLGGLSRFPILESPWSHWRYETWPTLQGREVGWCRRMRVNDQLGEWLNRHPGPVLAEQCGNPLLFGREAVVCDPFALFVDLVGAGSWNPEPLLEMLRRREVALIVLTRLGPDNPRFPPWVMGVIAENYEVVDRLGAGGDFILLPRPEEPPSGL